VAQDQGLQQVVQALREAQEQVLAQAQELVQVLGLAAAQVEELERVQKAALEWDLG
jgi:methylmalonyl-CoA mutase cobalamin-binding subunit